MTRAKFRCNRVSKYVGWNSDHPFLYNAEFNAVADNSEENKKFFAATPAGKIELSTVVSDLFEPGKTYYIDFTPAEE